MKAADTFIDEVTLIACGGDGGDGCCSFRREKFVPWGGPDGGDGGRGGSVVARASRNLATLLEYRGRRVIRAEAGNAGEGNGRTGRSGSDTVLAVPVGTLIYDADAPADSQPLADLDRDGATFRVALGGRGGRGNARFATPTRQAPDSAERGQPAQRCRVRLSLKLLAEVGLIGLPNAGKSTLLRRLSAARPRVGAYPFTTLVPSLGVAEYDERRFVVADIPGLIEGASEGAGLGDRFLRHVERTRVLVHLLDAYAGVAEGRDALGDYRTVQRELGNYDAALLERPAIVALNKIDLMADRAPLEPLECALREQGVRVLRVSGATGEGVAELLAALVGLLAEAHPDEAQAGPGREARP